MKNNVLPIILLSVLAVTPVNANASEQWSAGVGISFPLGLGVNAAYKFNESFKIRGVANYFHFTKKIADADSKGTANLNFRFFTVGILGDWHILKNGLRLTGGLMYNGNRLTGNVTFSENLTINGRTYTPQQIGEARGTLNYRSIAPYIGIGFDSHYGNKTGFNFTADVGLLFQGKVRGKVNSLTGQLANNAQAINDVKDDLVNSVNKKWWLKTTPVFSVGVSYKF